MSRWKIPWRSITPPQTITSEAQTTPRLTAKHIKAVIERGVFGKKAERLSSDSGRIDLDSVVSVVDDTDSYDNDQGVGSGGGTSSGGSSGGNVFEAIQDHHLIQLGVIKDDGKIDHLGLTDQKPKPSKINKNNFMYSHQALGEIFPNFQGFRGDTFQDLVTLAAGSLVFHSVGDILQVSYTINGQAYQQKRVITAEEDGLIINWAASYANGFLYTDINDKPYTVKT